MANAAQKIVVIDPGHGGIDPGAKSGKLQEAALNRKIFALLWKELDRDGKYLLKDSFSLAKKDWQTGTFPALDRRDAITKYNKSAQENGEPQISYIFSIHLNASTDAGACGASVLYNGEGNFQAAQTAYDKIIACASSKGVNLKGNRDEPLQDRSNLAMLNAMLAELRERVVGSASEFYTYIKPHFASMNFLRDPPGKVKEILSTVSSAGQFASVSSGGSGLAFNSDIKALGETGALADQLLAKLPHLEPAEHASVLFNVKEAGHVPALLFEVGFITNEKDAQIANSTPGIPAMGIAEAIRAILG